MKKVKPHMRSILQLTIYVVGSQKILKGRLVNPRIHAVGPRSPFTYQGKLSRSTEHCDIA